MCPFHQKNRCRSEGDPDVDQGEARANNMNIEEGHLGGYIGSNPHPPASGLDIRHGDPTTYSPGLWRWAQRELGVRSVLDVGCGEGHAAAYFRSMGCRVLGVDGSKQAKRDSQIPDFHVLHDYTVRPYTPSATFDLVWSCEFVEHVEERYLSNFLETFRASRRYLMMTYARPGQPGWHHVNCRTPQYWVGQLHRIGFQFDRDLTRASICATGPGHYRDNGLFFVRADMRDLLPETEP